MCMLHNHTLFSQTEQRFQMIINQQRWWSTQYMHHVNNYHVNNYISINYSSSSESSVSSSVSELPSSTVDPSSGFWIVQVCSLHTSVNFNPFVRHVQLGSLQQRRHLHAKSSKTTSGAGGVRIQWMTNWLSSSVVHPFLVGPGTDGWLWREHLQIAAW